MYFSNFNLVSEPVLPKPTKMQTSEHMICRGILIEGVLVGGPWMDTRCPPSHSVLLLSAAQGRVHMMHGSSVEIRAERDLSPITVMGKIDITLVMSIN